MCIRKLEDNAGSSIPPGGRAVAGEPAGLSEEERDRIRRARGVRSALAQLQSGERDVVVLRYLSGLSYSEIADLCDMDEPSARKQASRALLRLREHDRKRSGG
jgi:RNA polymerase sigma factor (sigma-70 family)